MSYPTVQAIYGLVVASFPTVQAISGLAVVSFPTVQGRYQCGYQDLPSFGVVSIDVFFPGLERYQCD